MNYYHASELRDADGQPSGKWHFTCQNKRVNGGEPYPVGYCRGGCPGHDTPEEAAEHYKQYQLDTMLRLDGFTKNQQHKCRVCGAWTQHFAEVDMHIFNLCDDHRTREHVAGLFEASTEMWGS